MIETKQDQKYKFDQDKGLTKKEVEQRYKQFGPNAIESKKQFLLLKNIIDQFTDFLVLVLVIAASISLVLGDLRTATALFSVVFLNAVIGFMQTYRTEKTLEALKNLLPSKCRVIRDSKETEILSKMLVPGDVVILQAGDSVPADGKILEYYSFKTNEASLTGEVSPQVKHEHPDSRHPHADLVFMGTTVLEGEARILVTGTGFKTKFGELARQTHETKDDASPLQKRLRKVGKKVAEICGLVMLLIIIFEQTKNGLNSENLFNLESFRGIFLFALAISAALVPEGLPATVSVALSISANRLMKKRAIIKKLASVETLGSTDVICTDKTGTLTEGKMSVVKIWPERFDSPQNFKEFKMDDKSLLAENWAVCQNIELVDGKLLGDPDEAALYQALLSKKIDPIFIETRAKKVHEISFNSIRKMMSMMVKENWHYRMYTKGNPHKVIDKCKLTDEKKKLVLSQIDEMAKEGLRIYAFAHRDFDVEPKSYKPDHLETELIYDGLVGFEDDIRHEVPGAIDYCKKVGIKIVMITGDYELTAISTAHKINLANDPDFRAISGMELAKMSDLELRNNLLHQVLFYETDPMEKLRIVETLQKMGKVVAVTGDGVNDSLALKKADIGIAMGRNGTDVAKEAADMILLDDNFATIVKAIKEGKLIWNNLRRFLLYVLSSDAGEFFTVFIAILCGLPLPLLAVQVLSVDLGTNIFPSLALAADPATKDVINQPAAKREDLLGKPVLLKLIYIGLVMGIGGALNFWLINGSGPSGTETYMAATTAAYATIVICQIVNVFEIRGGFGSFKNAFLSNKYLVWAVMGEIVILLSIVYLPPAQNFLSTRALNLTQWMPIIGIGVIYLIIEEYKRYYLNRKEQLNAKQLGYA